MQEARPVTGAGFFSNKGAGATAHSSLLPPMPNRLNKALKRL